MSESALRPFLDAAAIEYSAITVDEPRPCFGILLGTHAHDTFLVDEVAFGRNARVEHPSAREEFATTIVPRFGSAYENPVRAWWLDPLDLLRIANDAASRSLDILGSIHLHPDWHRLGPESERHHPLSDRPTPMDAHMFGNCGWPVNVVCYLERRHGGLNYSLAAWTENCESLSLLIRTTPTSPREDQP